MESNDLNKRIEEITLNGWPALQTVLYDGWLLRVSEGYTKRSNSINPIYGHSLPLDDKIAFCELFYKERGMDSVFKITPFSRPGNLDCRLEELGYRKAEHVLVQTLELAALQAPVHTEVEFSAEVDESWLGQIAELKGLSPAQIETKRKLFSGQPLKQCFASLKADGQPVAYGNIVLEDGWAGLSDIMTNPEYRGKGYGLSLTLHLLDWAKRNGAEKAYLLVVNDNGPALNLYGKVGFATIYEYWYRVKSLASQ
ncbi:GNAT family N-acetyltransferase [Paenibacillus sp. CAU 1782]